MIKSFLTLMISSSIVPSSIRIWSPFFTVRNTNSWGIQIESTLGINEGVIITFCPFSTGKGSLSTVINRISGPCRSIRMPMFAFNSAAIVCTLLIRSSCHSVVPCLVLKRKTFTPALINFLIVSGESLAGPRVATIFVSLSLVIN